MPGAKAWRINNTVPSNLVVFSAATGSPATKDNSNARAVKQVRQQRRRVCVIFQLGISVGDFTHKPVADHWGVHIDNWYFNVA